MKVINSIAYQLQRKSGRIKLSDRPVGSGGHEGSVPNVDQKCRIFPMLVVPVFMWYLASIRT